MSYLPQADYEAPYFAELRLSDSPHPDPAEFDLCKQGSLAAPL